MSVDDMKEGVIKALVSVVGDEAVRPDFMPFPVAPPAPLPGKYSDLTAAAVEIEYLCQLEAGSVPDEELVGKTVAQIIEMVESKLSPS